MGRRRTQLDLSPAERREALRLAFAGSTVEKVDVPDF